MKNIIMTLTLSSLVFFSPMAIEVTARGANTAQNIAETSKIEKLTIAVEKLLARLDQYDFCAENLMAYSPEHPAADANGCAVEFQPDAFSLNNSTTSPGSTGIGGTTFRADSATANKRCQDLGRGTLLSYSTRSFSSPGDNGVMYWDESAGAYKTQSAGSFNLWIDTLNCQKATYTP